MPATDITTSILVGNTGSGVSGAPVVADLANGNKFANDGTITVLVENPAGATPAVVALVIRETTTDPNVTLANGGGSIAGGASRVYGPFSKTRWNDATGFLTINVTGGNTPTIRLIK